MEKIRFIPVGKEDDKMFNRRLLAYYGLVFSVYWSHLILVVSTILYIMGKPMDAALGVAFLSVPGTLAGLGFWKYLKAAEKEDDKHKNKTTSSGTTNT